MIAVVQTRAGAFAIDLDSGDLEPSDPVEAGPEPSLNLPRVISSAQAGSTIVALLDARPPLLVSYDAGSTWRESGRGLPPGRAVAVAADDPDTLVYAGRNRLFVSRDGGVFWVALEIELPDVERIELRES